MKYYDISKLAAIDADYKFIVSGRGPGKSFQFNQMTINNFFNRGKAFGRVFRWETDIDPVKIRNWIDIKLIENCQTDHGVHPVYYRGGWHMMDDSTGKKKTLGQYGYTFSLNMEEDYKSGDYSNISDLVFEEFALRDPTHYLTGEIEAFNSLISTINRHRKETSEDRLTVWFIGNTLSTYNPYFEYFGIDANELKEGEIRLFKASLDYDDPAIVAVEYAAMPYTEEEEIPRILRVSGNAVATKGNYVKHEKTMTKEELADQLISKRNKTQNLFKVEFLNRGVQHSYIAKLVREKTPYMILVKERAAPADFRNTQMEQYLRQIQQMNCELSTGYGIDSAVFLSGIRATANITALDFDRIQKETDTLPVICLSPKIGDMDRITTAERIRKKYGRYINLNYTFYEDDRINHIYNMIFRRI